VDVKVGEKVFVGGLEGAAGSVELFLQDVSIIPAARMKTARDFKRAGTLCMDPPGFNNNGKDYSGKARLCPSA
jgi:hypothetical protein